MPESFDPYRKWLGIPPEDQPPTHYRLLGIALFEEDADVIAHAADRQMSHVRKFQSGKHSQLSQQLLNELAQARLCLLNAKQKAAYDKRLRAELEGKSRSRGHSRAEGVAAPRPSLAPATPAAHPTPPPAAPPPAMPPQPAPPPTPPAELDPMAPAPVAASTEAKAPLAVRSRPVSATARRSRRNSQAPLIVGLCVLAAVGLLAVLLVVAMSG